MPEPRTDVGMGSSTKPRTSIFGGRLLYGAAAYPETIDETIFTADAEHMRRLGMNVARIGEFMWSALEPEEGRIELDLLHRALDVLDASGLQAIVCTPTVAPPVWFTHGRPDRLHRTADGTVLGHGSRQHACTNNPDYRTRAATIASALAAAVGDDPRVAAWQLDNEFKSHVGGCHCQTCRGLWVRWLGSSYRSVDELNELWQTAVWSETYQSFGQVPLPGRTPSLHNTSLVNEFRRFSQASINSFGREQAATIRAHSGLPITHNSGFGFDLDNHGLYADLDFSSFDTYPAADNYPAFLMNLDFFPNLGRSGSTVLMETSTSHGGSIANYGRPHPAGFVEAEAFASYASGAAGFLFWHFRQHRGGSEQPHGSVVSASGHPTIGYAAADAAGRLLARIRPILADSSPARPAVALHYSDDAKGFISAEPGGGTSYRSLVSEFHSLLVRAGIDRSLLPLGGSLAGYRVLFTPFVPHLPEEERLRILEWVHDGGTWMAGPLTGGRTAHHTWHTDSALGGLEADAGVESAFQFPATGSGSRGTVLGHDAGLSGMSTFFAPLDGKATVLGTVTAGPADGLAFATERSVGTGRVILLGSVPDTDAALRALVEYAVARALPIVRTAGDGVVDYPRWRHGRLQHWLVNMGSQTAGFRLAHPARRLLAKEAAGTDRRPIATLAAGTHSLEPYGYVVLEEIAEETNR